MFSKPTFYFYNICNFKYYQIFIIISINEMTHKNMNVNYKFNIYIHI